MPPALTPARLHAFQRGSVLVPLNLLRLPDELEALGRRWSRKAELHVTAADTDAVVRQTGAGRESAWRAIAAAVESSERDVREVRLRGELREARKGDARTLVAMADVDDLRGFYRVLSERLGTAVEPPPHHVTLYAIGTERGIGIHTAQELEELTRVVDAPAAREALAGRS